jgi:hypothetical protein
MIKSILRVCLVFLILVLKFSALKAQGEVRVRCNAPTCEEPSDPGFSSHMNNSLVVTLNAKTKTIYLSLNYFQAPMAEVTVVNDKNELIKTEKVIINRSSVEWQLNVKKRADSMYTIKVVSLDRVYSAEVIFGSNDSNQQFVKL